MLLTLVEQCGKASTKVIGAKKRFEHETAQKPGISSRGGGVKYPGQALQGLITMTPERLDEILKGIAGASVAVVGDFCLDAYWILDDALSERSVETGKPTVPVRSQ